MTYSIEQLRGRLDQLPRFPLAHLPTPFEHLPRFSEALGGPRIWIKRDDCTGLAFGGNKTRHNELLIADAKQQGADTIVWGAGVQSNNCRQTAASCARAGLDIHLVLGRGGTSGKGSDSGAYQGNLLLDHILGASIEIVDEAEGPQLDKKIVEAADRLTAQGRKVYARVPKIVKPLAALSYVTAVIEIIEQADSAGFVPDAIFVCSAGSTGAGISLAIKALGKSIPVTHCTPIVWPWNTQAVMTEIANAAAERLDIETRLTNSDINVTEEFVGEGYGIPSPGCLEAMTLLARTEGIFVDPSYSAKSMAGLIHHVRARSLTADQNVVFIHTGGTPALFAYSDVLTRDIASRTI